MTNFEKLIPPGHGPYLVRITVSAFLLVLFFGRFGFLIVAVTILAGVGIKLFMTRGVK